MLREKQEAIETLKNEYYLAAKSFGEAIEKRRIEEQEDILFRVKEAGELIAMGDSYNPSAIMSLSSVSLYDRISLAEREKSRQNVFVSVVEQLSPHTSGLSGIGKISVEDKINCSHWFLSKESSDNIISLESLSFNEIYDCELNERVISELSSSILNTNLSATMITEDIEPEVYSIAAITNNLAMLRNSFPDKYKAAYICLSVPDVLQKIVLLDILPESLSLFHQSFKEYNSSLFDKKEFELQFINQSQNEFADSLSSFQLSDRLWHEPLLSFSTSSDAASKLNDGNIEDDGDSNLLPKV
jgi:hypothetical protein